MPDSRTLSTTRPNRVEVEFFSTTTAVIALAGEHDLATSDTVKEALTLAASRRRHMIVDLSACTFLDSTVISMLVWAHYLITSHKGRFALVLPDGSAHTARVIHAMRLQEILPVCASLAEGVIFVEHATRVRDLRVRVDEAQAYGASCECGWTGEPRTGEFAERKARADGNRHSEAPPAL